MDTEQLVDSFKFRFAAGGMREPQRTAEELVAHVLGCSRSELGKQLPDPPSSGQQMELILQFEKLAERIEGGESPQDVLNCPDF